MALKIQYNKTFSQQLKKQLVIRERALPTLKSKETALRIEVKKAAERVEKIQRDLLIEVDELKKAGILLREFPDILRIDQYKIGIRNVAGVKVPYLEELGFRIETINFFNNSAWLLMGIESLKKIVQRKVEFSLAKKQFEILNYSRKKTTQKVNLYEKVQIPEFRESILKIKRYLEDEENLLKAAQKIVKERHLASETEP